MKTKLQIKTKCTELDSSYKSYKMKLGKSGFGLKETDPESIKGNTITLARFLSFVHLMCRCHLLMLIICFHTVVAILEKVSILLRDRRDPWHRTQCEPASGESLASSQGTRLKTAQAHSRPQLLLRLPNQANNQLLHLSLRICTTLLCASTLRKAKDGRRGLKVTWSCSVRSSFNYSKRTFSCVKRKWISSSRCSASSLN